MIANCHDDCLLPYAVAHVAAVVAGCKRDCENLKGSEKKNYFLEKIRMAIVCNKSKRYKYCWKVGAAPAPCIDNVCKTCFLQFYDIGHTYVESIVSSIKNNVKVCNTALNPQNVPCSQKLLKELQNLATAKGRPLSSAQVAALVIPNAVSSLQTYAWLADYFNLTGDVMPNSNEIHLEPISIKDVYSPYVQETAMFKFSSIGLSAFYSMWNNCFPHVRIREFKAVCGKCTTCSDLSNLRKSCRDSAGRAQITKLHYFHRIMYMGERMQYAERRNLAAKYPSEALSIISDGMQQAHCLLPWFANNSSWGNDSLTQHIQGVNVHGRKCLMFRTFHNIANTYVAPYNRAYISMLQ
jgi:hypothetical protein